LCTLFTISFNLILNHEIGPSFVHNDIVSPMHYLSISKNKQKNTPFQEFKKKIQQFRKFAS